MPQIINTNIASLNAQRNLDRSQGAQDTALERLSSGLRINSAADDAAGLAISTRFESQTQGLEVGIRNANDGVSLAQTAEGALGSMTENLQRIRELSLQSANATNSAQDRESLNAEVQELKAEIKRVSEQTNFNGTNLLDGSFQKATFQIGANRGETVGVDIAGTTPNTLGAAKTDGVTSFPSASGDNDRDMAGGDLVINGISIDAPDAADDKDSFKDAGQSAIARAAAVNAKSDDSGVKAVVNETSVSGAGIQPSAKLPVNADANDPVVMELNGKEIEMPSGTAGQSAESFLNSVVSSINKKTDQTKVEASFSGDPRAGVELTAPDGENITIDFSSNTNGDAENPDGTGIDTQDMAARYGLADTKADGTDNDASTFRGTYTLISEDGSDIDLSTTGDISRAGFQVGSFSGNNSGTVSSVVGGSALEGDDLTINGTTIGSSRSGDDTGSPNVTDPASSAIAKAAAINRSSDSTGVTAEATPTILTSGNINESGITGEATFKINGEDVSPSLDGSETATEAQQKIVNAVNDAGITGVSAESFSTASGRSFRLIAEDGRNIAVTDLDISNLTNGASDLGLESTATQPIAGSNAGQVQRASVSLESAGAIEIGTLSGKTESSGFEVGTFGANESGQLLRDVDISTVEGANDAITSIDNALNQVNRQRANLGAIQNRFESTIENQQVSSENLTAANSRIRDADFAKQSAELSRTQTLQQAGISVLSQANQRPQQVLQLLQG
ncbi:flagellin [Salicola sp. Rm-C-2C1-2]|uniref:flagellin N-terminal helical domain-containing protein n=1 Tax=Salicola sp. Rm-C-2C1-2 TaxID=3141321 RepID=UPI0032E4DAEF